MFAHTAAIFFERGIARPESGEIASCSVEECLGLDIIVSLFEIKATDETVAVRALLDLALDTAAALLELMQTVLTSL